jgi:hypothetical protein
MNDKEIDAVRRTLERIQRMASEPLDDGSSPAGDLGDGAARSAGRLNRLPGQRTAPPVWMLAGGGVIVLMAVGAAGLTLMGPQVHVAQKAEAPVKLPEVPAAPKPAPAPVPADRAAPERQPASRPATTASLPNVPVSRENEAQGLLEAGRVSDARRMLAGMPKKSPEAALILARSYDPNYLRQLPNADAVADANEAERWYRTWKTAAAEQGLVMEPERFERIIKAMR